MEELMLMTITKLKDAIKNVTQNEHSNNIINIKLLLYIFNSIFYFLFTTRFGLYGFFIIGFLFGFLLTTTTGLTTG